MEEGVYVGLDIGTAKTCILVGKAMGDKMEVVGIGECPSKGIRNGVIVNIDDATACIIEAIHDAQLTSGHKISSVYVSVSGEHISGFPEEGVVSIHRNEVEWGDVERVLSSAGVYNSPKGGRILHSLIQEFMIDDNSGIKNPLGILGTKLATKVYLLTAALPALQNVVKCIHNIDLDITDLVLAPLASGLSVLTKDEMEVGIILLDIGGGTTELAVFKDDELRHVIIFPVGGLDINLDIVRAFKITRNEAENAKIMCECGTVTRRRKGKEGSAECGVRSAEWKEKSEIRNPKSEGGDLKLNKQSLSRVVEKKIGGIFERLAGEIESTGLYGELSAGVVITGGTSKLKGIIELAEETFELPVRVGVGTGIRSMLKDISEPQYSTCIGLLRWGHQGRMGMVGEIRDEKILKKLRNQRREWLGSIR